MTRHWYFEDGIGGPVMEVSGEGVVGQKPFLRPGQAFEYYSGTSLTARNGYMYGELEFRKRECVAWTMTLGWAHAQRCVTFCCGLCS